jgi:hypothetical protein
MIDRPPFHIDDHAIVGRGGVGPLGAEDEASCGKVRVEGLQKA